MGRVTVELTIFVVLAVLFLGKNSEFSKSLERLANSTADVNMKMERRAEFLNRKLDAVLENFMLHSTPELFSRHVIEKSFKEGLNGVLLVHIDETLNVTFQANFEDGRHGRTESVHYILRRVVNLYGKHIPIPDGGLSFLVGVDDCAKPSIPTFCAARHYTNWYELIPAPLGNDRGSSLDWATPLDGWDKKRKKIAESHSLFPWYDKENRAVFYGTLRMQERKLGSYHRVTGRRYERAINWKQVNRGVLYERTKHRSDLFNITFVGKTKNLKCPDNQLHGAPPIGNNLNFTYFQQFKYVLNVGANHDWAERLRVLLLLNSAVVVHEAETQEYFTPLLIPWKHYIPTNVFMTDLVDNVDWATRNDEKVRNIVRNANEFAQNFLSEHAMEMYWQKAITKFSKRQRWANMALLSKYSS